MTLLLLPNQLFYTIPNGISTIILYEHPKFFTKFKYHKAKLVYHRATMKAFADEIKSKHATNGNKYDIEYVEFTEKFTEKSTEKFTKIHRWFFF